MIQALEPSQLGCLLPVPDDVTALLPDETSDLPLTGAAAEVCRYLELRLAKRMS